MQLTAGYRDALTLEQGQSITFNQNAFVESRPSSMQPFLRKMLELQIFQQVRGKGYVARRDGQNVYLNKISNDE